MPSTRGSPQPVKKPPAKRRREKPSEAAHAPLLALPTPWGGAWCWYYAPALPSPLRGEGPGAGTTPLPCPPHFVGRDLEPALRWRRYGRDRLGGSVEGDRRGPRVAGVGARRQRLLGSSREQLRALDPQPGARFAPGARAVSVAG